MIQQLKLAAFVLLIGLAVVLLLAVMSDYANGGDYVVSRGTMIASERPIGLLVVEAGMGVVNAEVWPLRKEGGGVFVRSDLGAIRLQSVLAIDGRPATGIGGMARAAWRLGGFVLWDEAGRIERTTTISVHGHVVHIYDRVSNGSVRVRVVVGPPLGDPLVRCAVLELEANDVETGIRDGWAGRLVGTAGSTIRLRCSAVIDLPGDRCGLIRRIAERVAKREAGPELTSRVRELAEAGRLAVLDGRGRLTDSVVAEFLETVCR